LIRTPGRRCVLFNPLEFTRVRAGQFLDIWSRLQRERIMYIGQDLDDEYANQVFVDPLVCVCIWIT